MSALPVASSKPAVSVSPPAGRNKLRAYVQHSLGWLASVGIFVAIWELCWLFGLADPLMLPPPHIFLANLPEQFRFFDPAGARSLQADGGGLLSVLEVMAWTSMRVILGLALGFVGAVGVGLAIRYFPVFGKLTLPTITLLTPI